MGKKLELVATLHAVVTNNKCPMSVEELAVLLDKAPSTLYNELNPYPSEDSRHKLGLEDAATIAKAIGDEGLARHFASLVCGLELLDKPTSEPDGRDMDHECLQGFQATARFIEAAQHGDRKLGLAPLLEEAIKELRDVFLRAAE